MFSADKTYIFYCILYVKKSYTILGLLLLMYWNWFNFSAVVPTTKSSLDEIDADPELLLLEKEPDTWVETVDKEVRNFIFFYKKKN